MLSEVQAIVNLLMKRPITEDVITQVKAIPGYARLEIQAGEWIGFPQTEDEMTTGEKHGWIEALLIILLGSFVLKHKLGRVYPGDVTFVLDGKAGDVRVMREPDVSFVAAERVEPSSGFIYSAPDLAVEIISPSQGDAKMVGKIGVYFKYGTKQVWLVLPDSKQLEVHTPDNKVVKYGISDTLSGSNLLPGFTLEVAMLFDS